jgi:GNAT superfamily N-acetyltransferase
VVRLLRRVLDRPGQGVHDDAFFAWKHLDNPFGPSIMLVAEVDDRIVGFRAFMRWRLEIGGRAVDAGRPVDTVTDPDLRRQGVFSALTRAAIERLEAFGIEMLFNTPNDQSLPGYLKMGWTPLGRATRTLLIGGPMVVGRAMLTRVTGAGVREPAAADPRNGAAPGAWDALATALRARAAGGVAVAKSPAYLRWRYADHPWFRYFQVGERGPGAVVRLTSSRRVPMAIIAESTAASSEEWGRLLAATAARTGCPVVQFLHTHPAQMPGGRGWLWMRRPGPMIVARRAGSTLPDLAGWFLTTGELEFF